MKNTIDSSSEKSDTGAKEKSLRKEIFEWIYAILLAVAITLVIKFFAFDIVRVDGNSMVSTLHDEDKLILWKLGYSPKSQDVIVLDSNFKKRETALAELESTDNFGFWDSFMFNVNPPTEYKKRHYVKRVIGLPGDEIDIRDNVVYVNSVALEEDYLDEGVVTTQGDILFPFIVPEDNLFVMGDNRGKSLDSRSDMLGFVPIDAVLGKATIKILPLSDIGMID